MKKTILILFVCIIGTTTIFAQKSRKSVEVLYFKANLSCCQAKSCNAIEGDIKSIVEDNYESNVVFKQIKLEDETNKPLIEKYNAKSQTVVLVKYIRTKEKESVDVSKIVKQYAYDKNKDNLKNELTTAIDELLN